MPGRGERRPWRACARFAVVVCIVTGTQLTLAASAAAATRTHQARTARATVAGLPYILQIGSLSVTGFQYDGIVTVATASGPVSALEFSTTTSSASQFATLPPCPAGHVREAVVAPSFSAPHGLTIDVTAISIVVLGTTITWTVASPPPSPAPLPGGSGTFGPVTADVLLSTAPSISASGLVVAAGTC